MMLNLRCRWIWREVDLLNLKDVVFWLCAVVQRVVAWHAEIVGERVLRVLWSAD